MPSRSILLRVLLSLCLVLNGAGNAIAAVHMHAAAGQAPASMQPASMQHDVAEQAVAAAPCHEQASENLQAPLTPDDPSGSDSPDPSPDCCKSGGCQCACVQHAQVVVLMDAPRQDSRASEPALHALDEGMPAPAPTRLLRPPIG